MKRPASMSSVEHDADRHLDLDRPLPEGWTLAGLGVIADSLTYGYTASATAGSHGPRFLRITDIQNGRVNWDSVPTCTIEETDIRKYGLVPGDIVFARTGATTGKSFLIRSCPLAVFASYLIRLRLFPEINPALLDYFFQTPDYWAFISDNVAGIAQPNCNATKLSDLQIPIPPSEEQKRLVKAIAVLLSKVGTARDHLSRVPAILKRFRQAVLSAACSGKLTEDWRGNCAQDWKECTLGQILREPLRNGHSARASFNGSGVRTLTLSAVTYGDFSERNTKLTVADPRKVSDLWLLPGDILIERSNSRELVGTARLYEGAANFAIFPDLLIRVRLNKEASPAFLEMMLQADPARDYFIKSAQGTQGSMPKIDQQIILDGGYPLDSGRPNM